MTEAQARRLVKTWQDRLGLEHWTVKTEIGIVEHDGEDPDDRDVFARIFRHQRYDDAVLELADWTVGLAEPPDRIEAALLDDELVERKIVHELLHLVLRDLAKIVQDDLDGYLHRDVTAFLDAAWERAEERAIDNLARALVKAWPRASSQKEAVNA